MHPRRDNASTIDMFSWWRASRKKLHWRICTVTSFVDYNAGTTSPIQEKKGTKNLRCTCRSLYCQQTTDAFCLYGHYSYARRIEIWNTQYVWKTNTKAGMAFSIIKKETKSGTRTTTFCPINLFDATMRACLPADHETNAAQRIKELPYTSARRHHKACPRPL